MAVLYYIPGMMRMEKKHFGIRLHVMAQVLEEMYPGIKLTLDHISNGFYRLKIN
jgi:hypothetical protein